ncbi:MAG: isoprenylcysteine carboxylmethyltransferase family protein [Gammaproteobacteria bacterium]|nr:isoprenylcysteine carboxylmethyltransferase family protein [Gammaproteobacteria bacterium]
MSALELKIPPVLATILFAALMWAIHRFTPGMTLPQEVRILLVVFAAILSAGTGLAGVASFKRAKTTVNPLKPEDSSTLVASGIFKRTRNPMYLALLLLLAGWGIYLSNPFSLLLAAGFILYMNRFQIAPEERALEEKFGAAFRDYKKQVRRWI